MHTESILDDYMFARVYNYACLCVGGWASMCIIMFGRVTSSLLKGYALVHNCASAASSECHRGIRSVLYVSSVRHQFVTVLLKRKL